MPLFLLLLLPIALIAGCGQDDEKPEPTPKPRDDVLVKLMCDKDTPDYFDESDRQSYESYANFAGDPQSGDKFATLKGRFAFKTMGQWSYCKGNEEISTATFKGKLRDTFDEKTCVHDSPTPVDLIVWVPGSIDGPEKVDPALGCKPTVEPPK